MENTTNDLRINPKIAKLRVTIITSILALECVGWELVEYYGELAEELLSIRKAIYQLDKTNVVLVMIEGTPNDPEVFYCLLDTETNTATERKQCFDPKQSLADVIELLQSSKSTSIKSDLSVTDTHAFTTTFIQNKTN